MRQQRNVPESVYNSWHGLRQQILHGIVGSTDVESMERYGVEVVLVPGAGHFMMMEDPERFNALLTEVVEGLSR